MGAVPATMLPDPEDDAVDDVVVVEEDALVAKLSVTLALVEVVMEPVVMRTVLDSDAVAMV